jgi:hypothetical protein
MWKSRNEVCPLLEEWIIATTQPGFKEEIGKKRLIRYFGR